MKKLDGYMHGVNLGGWLSQCNYEPEHCQNFIKEEDIKQIADWGLDHVRVPVDYNLFQDKNGAFIDRGFKHVDDCISWCKKYGIHMVLDLHKTAGFSFDLQEGEVGLFENPKYQEQFYSLWEEFAKRYAKNQDMMCFELLNEVTDQSFCKAWNAIAKECIKRIRKIDPTVKILVGSYWNNSVSAVKDMDPPYDENIVYNFHCYEPIIFTHQGAGWVSKEMDRSFRMSFDETYAKYTEYQKKLIPQIPCYDEFPQDEKPSADFFEKRFAETLKVAEERNVALYCGEYGVIDYAKPEDVLSWYKEITTVLDKYGIGRAAWSYKGMNFGLSDEWIKPVISEITKLM